MIMTIALKSLNEFAASFLASAGSDRSPDELVNEVAKSLGVNDEFLTEADSALNEIVLRFGSVDEVIARFPEPGDLETAGLSVDFESFVTELACAAFN
jgi:hypothetical protein